MKHRVTKAPYLLAFPFFVLPLGCTGETPVAPKVATPGDKSDDADGAAAVGSSVDCPGICEIELPEVRYAVVREDTLYAAVGEVGLVAIDLESQSIKTQLPLSRPISSLLLHNETLYAAAHWEAAAPRDAEVLVIDVASDPVEQESVPVGGERPDLVSASPDRLLIANYFGLAAFDLQSGEQIGETTRLNDYNSPYGFGTDIRGNKVCVPRQYYANLSCIDLDLTDPVDEYRNLFRRRADGATDDLVVNPKDVKFLDDRAFVSTMNGLTMVDLTDPANELAPKDHLLPVGRLYRTDSDQIFALGVDELIELDRDGAIVNRVALPGIVDEAHLDSSWLVSVDEEHAIVSVKDRGIVIVNMQQD